MRCFFTLLFLTCGIYHSLVADQKPNIVIFLTDDQGWGDLSVHGNTNLETPNIDSLARDGASFENF
ncbi:MAG: sulfatase-like hydrolase/transferase, partial [Verrucomicrobiales bacterium]|nr:sulfatase-like hydrolase/transferase [Verrucomicrobiales bacterium]